MIEEAEATVLDDDFQQILDKLEATGEEISERLQGQFALFKVTTHTWRGRYKSRKAEITYGGDDLTESRVLSKPYWNLLPPRWKQEFESVESRKESILKEYSIPSKVLNGVRIVMSHKLEECCSRLDSLANHYSDVADAFCTASVYNEVIEHVKKSLANAPAAAEEAVKLIPNLATMRKRFGMERIVIPTALPSWAVGDNSSFHAQEMKRSERRLLASNLASLVEQPRQELSEALRGFMDQLVTVHPLDGEVVAKAKRRLTRDSVEALEKQIAACMNFQDVLDDSLLDYIDELGGDLKQLMADMAAQSKAKTKLEINNNDDLAIAFGRRAQVLAENLMDKDSMIRGMKKMCEVET